MLVITKVTDVCHQAHGFLCPLTLGTSDPFRTFPETVPNKSKFKDDSYRYSALLYSAVSLLSSRSTHRAHVACDSE